MPSSRHAATTSGAKMPSATNRVAAAEVDRAGAAAAVLRDLVDGDLAAARRAQLAQRGEGVGLVPGVRVVPVDEPGVGAGGDPRQGRVVAVLVEVVEAQDRESEALGEAGLPGAARAGQDDDLGSAHLLRTHFLVRPRAVELEISLAQTPD